MLNYNNIGYQNLLDEGYVKRSAHEDLMQDALELWKNGKVRQNINALQPEVLILGTLEPLVDLLKDSD